MTSVEDRVRAATDAISRQVEAAPPRPLPLPPPALARRGYGRPPRRRWGPWLAPAAAAVAMIAVALTLVVVRNGPAGQPSPPASAVSVNGVPHYYVTVPGNFSDIVDADHAIVGDTFTGKQLATIPAPAGWGFVSVAAAGDDRTFVLGAGPRQASSAGAPTRWYLVHLTPGSAHLATLRQIPIPPQPPGRYATMALSPHGTKLALMTQVAPIELRIFSTASGAVLHTWSLSSRWPLSRGSRVGLLSWTSDSDQLAFWVSVQGLQLRVLLLQAGDPGHNLLADSRTGLSLTIPSGRGQTAGRQPACSGGGYVTGSFQVAGDGKTIVCGNTVPVRGSGNSGSGKACPAAQPPQTMQIYRYSTATGKLTTLYQTAATCNGPSDPALLWASRDGNAVIGYFFTGSQRIHRWGLFTPGKFTPLPAPPTFTTVPANIAW